MCGISSGYKDYKYLYFWTPMKGYLNRTTCVKSCPSPVGDIEIAKYYYNSVLNLPAEKQVECIINTLVP